MVYSSFIRSFYLALLIATSVYATTTENRSAEHPSKNLPLAISSGVHNPARLAQNERITTTLALSPSSKSNYLLQESGVILPFKVHTLGVHYTTANALDAEVIPIKDKNDSIWTESFEHEEFTLGLTYAIQPAMKRVSIGTTIKYYQVDDVLDGLIQGMSLDLGVGVKILEKKKAGTHRVGLHAKNLLSPDKSFEKLQQESPTLGFRYNGLFLNEKFKFQFDLEVDEFTSADSFYASTVEADGNIDVKDGVRTAWTGLFWKAGYKFNRFAEVEAGVGNQYFTVGTGLNLATLRKDRDLSINYNFNKFHVDDKKWSHMIAARVEFLNSRRD